MKDKVLLITGAASGIGLAIGTLFAESGATVVMTDKNAEVLDAIVANLRASQLDVIGLGCDVTVEAEICAVVSETFCRYGRIDYLINNAGLQYIAPIEDFPSDKFELLLKVMLTAPFLAIKQVFPIMKKQQFGRIINMASINGLIGFAGKAAYNSAKHGVIGLTKVAALESATYGITVNAVCPGYVDTPLVRNQLASLAQLRRIDVDEALEQLILPMVPQKRLITVEEITSCIAYLVGESARGITGQAIVIDGGYTAQ